MPAVVSTSGRIHGELLWEPYVLADIQRFSGILASRDFSNEAFRWIRVKEKVAVCSTQYTAPLHLFIYERIHLALLDIPQCARSCYVHDEDNPGAQCADNIFAPRVGDEEESDGSDPSRCHWRGEKDEPSRKPGLSRGHDIRDPERGNHNRRRTWRVAKSVGLHHKYLCSVHISSACGTSCHRLPPRL